MTQQRPDPISPALFPADQSIAPARPDGQPASQAVLDSQVVLRGHQAITIAHNGNHYRLQTTRQGKLILTK